MRGLLFWMALATAGSTGCGGCAAGAEGEGAAIGEGEGEGEGEAGSGIVVQKDVAGCDAVFATGGDEVPGVVFSEGIDGEFVARAPRFAVSFVKDGGVVAGTSVARFAFTREGAPAVTLVSHRCFSADGAAVADAVVLR